MAPAAGPLKLPPDIEPGMVSWSAPRLLWRVHMNPLHPSAFNASSRGNARFSPLRDAHGAIVPALYAATSLDAALMETVLRNAPGGTRHWVFDLQREEELAAMGQGNVASRIHITTKLALVDLTSIGLQRLGLTRGDCIDTTRYHYARTRELAQTLHRICPDAHGLLWTSRKDDTAQAVLLFGDRLEARNITAPEAPAPVHQEPVRSALVHLVQRLGGRVLSRRS